ncbi:MAG: hypothetical protein HOO67_00680 [Candidatus Peribacteraceae bacterium]|nr:hypothetical protein [Candidatus Peribacteraceae bacterium]
MLNAIQADCGQRGSRMAAGRGESKAAVKPAETTQSKTLAGEPSGAVKPKLFMRGQQTFVHSLFRGSTEKMKKNTSYKKFVPELHDIEHTHFYHSHDSHGAPQTYTQPVGGHFHEIVSDGVDENGYPKMKCGPALRFVDKKLNDGTMTRVIEEVKWLTNKPGVMLDDKHSHVMTYLGSEELSQAKINEGYARDKARIGTLPSPEAAEVETANAEG